MSKDWSDRQRNTNALARSLANYIFQQDDVSPSQLYGLSKLAWITNSYEGNNPAYVQSTKIPALSNILGVDFQGKSIANVADDAARMIGDKSIVPLIENHTGFTNFYKAYRNSVSDWVARNHKKLLPMYKSAYLGTSDEERLALVRKVANVPGIPKANHPEQLMHPENFLTPAFFILDGDVRFPLINGNKHVKSVLKALDVSGSSLADQYRAIVRLYDVDGIRDAADVDQIGRHLPNDIADLITSKKRKATKRILRARNTGELRSLPLKDETDVAAIKSSGTIKYRRIHNRLTNNIVTSLCDFTLLEGCDNSCMFDVLVKNHDHDGNDLLIEVKSSCESADVRMAVGQLFDYWLNLKHNLDDPYLAVLLPGKPNEKIVRFLESMDMGLLWYENRQLFTGTDWLKHLVTRQ